MPPYSNADYPVTHTRKEQILNLVELLLKEDTDGPNQHGMNSSRMPQYDFRLD